MKELTGRTSRGATSETKPPSAPPTTHPLSTQESLWSDEQNTLIAPAVTATQSWEGNMKICPCRLQRVEVFLSPLCVCE